MKKKHRKFFAETFYLIAVFRCSGKVYLMSLDFSKESLHSSFQINLLIIYVIWVDDI